METAIKRHILEYYTFKESLPVASSQMLRIMAKVEIEMMTGKIKDILKTKYHVEHMPEDHVISEILENTFENSIIRSDSELRKFLKKQDPYDDTIPNDVLFIKMRHELEDITKMIQKIYNTNTTSCYSDFARRCTEDITKELRLLNQSEEFEIHTLKMKMQLMKELNKVLQTFLNGAYKTIHTQMLMNMQRQMDLLEQYEIVS